MMATIYFIRNSPTRKHFYVGEMEVFMRFREEGFSVIFEYIRIDGIEYDGELFSNGVYNTASEKAKEVYYFILANRGDLIPQLQ